MFEIIFFRVYIHTVYTCATFIARTNITVRRAGCLILSVSSYSSRFAIAWGKLSWLVLHAISLSRFSHGNHASRTYLKEPQRKFQKGRGRRCYLLRFALAASTQTYRVCGMSYSVSRMRIVVETKKRRTIIYLNT